MMSSAGTVTLNTSTPPCVPTSVTSPNVTSVTAADHPGFGQEPAGAVGAVVVRVISALPFGPGVKVPLALTSVVNVCPGATLPAGLVHSTVAVAVEVRVTSRSVEPSPETLPVQVSVRPLSVHVGPA